MEDSFQLHDLAVVVEEIRGTCTCGMSPGDRVVVRGGRLTMPDGDGFCLYALQSTLPLLPAKQRQNDPADWMETDAGVACPDPACGLVMRIERIGVSTFRNAM